jgi:hypothetical protein
VVINIVTLEGVDIGIFIILIGADGVRDVDGEPLWDDVFLRCGRFGFVLVTRWKNNCH